MSGFRPDAAESGVYRVARAAWIADAARGHGLAVAHVHLEQGAGKAALLAALAAALRFPPWFGGNWDALEDCLCDLSWLPSSGHLLLIEGAQTMAPDDLGVLRDILSSAAQFWKERGQPFFAVLVAGPRTLPELTGATKR